VKVILTAIGSLYLALVLQQALPDRISVLGARPDFILVVTIALALLTRAPSSIVVGFWGGVIQGAIVGANLGQFVITRMITAYAASRLNDFEIEIGVVLGAIFIGIGSIVAQLLMMFLAPPRSLGGFLGDTIAMAVYNAVLAVPIYAILRRILREPRA